jgi:hypothetical protein
VLTASSSRGDEALPSGGMRSGPPLDRLGWTGVEQPSESGSEVICATRRRGCGRSSARSWGTRG